jgi:RNA polymerase sigma-70 factor (ECF subfamily)
MFKRLPITTIVSLQAGDEAAFNNMYDHYRDLLYVIIFSITKHVETSQDLLQDTFIKVFTEVKTLKNPLKFHSWIIQIAKNLALNAIKKPGEQLLDETTWNYMGQNDDPSDFISLWHKNLSRIENLIIAYHLVYGLTFQEISHLIESPLTNTHRLYKQALATLKVSYANEGADNHERLQEKD